MSIYSFKRFRSHLGESAVGEASSVSEYRFDLVPKKGDESTVNPVVIGLWLVIDVIVWQRIDAGRGFSIRKSIAACRSMRSGQLCS